MADLAIVLLIGMAYSWYMSTSYALVIDTSKKGMTLVGLAPKASPED